VVLGVAASTMATIILGGSRRMEGLTKQDLQDVVREVLVERNALGGEQHANDHAFLTIMQEREVRRIARVEKFKMSMIGTAATGLVGGLVWVGKLIVDHW